MRNTIAEMAKLGQILEPAITNRWTVEFLGKYGTHDIMRIQATQFADVGSRIIITFELDTYGGLIEDYYDFIQHLSNASVRLNQFAGEGKATFQFIYTGLKIKKSMLNELKWDYSKSDTVKLELELSYKKRKLNTYDVLSA